MRKLLESLLSPAEGERQAAAGEVRKLDQRELAELLHLLHQQVRRESMDARAWTHSSDWLIAALLGQPQRSSAALAELPKSRVDPSVAYDLQRLVVESKVALGEVRPLLENWAASQTRVARAAAKRPADLDKPKGGKK